MTWIRCLEEVEYQRQFWEYLSDHLECTVPDISLDLVCFERPYNSHWSFKNRAQSFSDIYLETCFRVDPEMGKVLALWKNVEAFAIPPRFRKKS